MSRVLIIGATSAIAGLVAQRYAAQGSRLFLVARDAAKLARMCDDLGDAVVGTIACDLNETHHNADHVARAMSALGGADIAILAHGLLGNQLETERSYTAAQDVITTNLSSMISLLIPLANAMQTQGSGHIAVLSSVAGERGRPRNYTYGAAKGALTVYLQGLRSRLYPCGVEVHTFKLGPVDTPMTKTHKKNATFATATRVADDIVAHLGGRGGAHYVPWFWAPIMALVRSTPEQLFQRVRALSGR